MSGPTVKTKASVDSKQLRTMAQIREAALALLDPERADAEVVDAHLAHEALDLTLTALDAVLREQRHLELLVQKLRRASSGKSSERVSSEQLRLMFEELVDSMDPDGAPESALSLQEETMDDVNLDKEIETAKSEEDNGSGPKKRRVQKVSIERAKKKDHYPKAGDDVRLCPHCGEDRKPIGEEVTTRLEYVPGHFIRHDHHLQKYACPKCKDGVGTTKAPPQVIPRSVATPMLLAKVVISKYVDHQPLHRQHRIFARTGVTIPVSTLAEWVARVGDLLAPIVDRLTPRVKGAWIVRTDASGLRVLDPTSPENIEKGTMWCYVGDDKDVVFEFAPTGEGATGPWKFLSGRTGYIQADA